MCLVHDSSDATRLLIRVTERSAAPSLRFQAPSTYVPNGQQAIKASDVLRMLGIIAVNGIAVTTAHSSSTRDRVALALYPTTALANHSCSPTCSLRFGLVGSRAR